MLRDFNLAPWAPWLHEPADLANLMLILRWDALTVSPWYISQGHMTSHDLRWLIAACEWDNLHCLYASLDGFHRMHVRRLLQKRRISKQETPWTICLRKSPPGLDGCWDFLYANETKKTLFLHGMKVFLHVHGINLYLFHQNSLVAEILHHLESRKPYKSWAKLRINWFAAFVFRWKTKAPRAAYRISTQRSKAWASKGGQRSGPWIQVCFWFIFMKWWIINKYHPKFFLL